MSLMKEILGYIQANPGVRATDLKLIFPKHDRTAVQRAAYRLFESGYTSRQEVNKQFCYFPERAHPDITALPLEELARAAGLIKKAEELELKGLYQRAATVWLEAFSASRVASEREKCLRQRKKCLARRIFPSSPERVYELAGRFNGDI